MGDRIWWYEDCPKCGAKGDFEHFEHDSADLRLNNCSNCGYTEHFNFTERKGVIHIEKVNPKKDKDHER